MGATLQMRWLGLTAVKGLSSRNKMTEGLPVTSNKSIAVTMVLGLGLVFIPAAWADPASDACAALANARGALYSMALAKEKSAQDSWDAKVQAASTKLDSVLVGMTASRPRWRPTSR
jgi:hypothetical protein